MWVLVSLSSQRYNYKYNSGGSYLQPINAALCEKAQCHNAVGNPAANIIKLSLAMVGGVTGLESGFEFSSYSGFNRALSQAYKVVSSNR